MDAALHQEEIEGWEGEKLGNVVCETTSMVCGTVLMGAQLDLAGVLLACPGPTVCNPMPALVDVQVAEPEPVSQVSKPAMCGAGGESGQGGGELGLPLSRSVIMLMSEATPVKMCELVSAEIVLVPGEFGTDSVRGLQPQPLPHCSKTINALQSQPSRHCSHNHRCTAATTIAALQPQPSPHCSHNHRHTAATTITALQPQPLSDCSHNHR